MATRWRWPPDRLVPRSPTGESRPSGRAATRSASEACWIAACSSASEASGRAIRMLARRRVVEEIGVLRDQRDQAAQLVELVVAQVGAVQRDAAGIGIPEAHQQLRRRGLAGARGADQRHRLAGGDLEADVGQRAARLAGIGEVHLLQRECRGALARRHARAVAHRDRLVGQRIDAPRGAQRVGELAADLGDLRHRQEGRHGEDGEQRQQAGIDARRCCDSSGAGHDDGEAAQAGQHFEDGVLQRELAEEGQAQRDVALRELVELGAARVLLLEGHDLAQALHRIDGEGAEFAGRLARLAAQPVDALAHQERAQADGEQERQQRQRQPAVGPGERRRPRRPAPGWRRRPAPRCGRRNTRPARCRGWRAPSDRRCGGAPDRPAPAHRACGRRRCASRPAGGRPCRAPARIPASAARPTAAPRWRARWRAARRARGSSAPARSAPTARRRR